MSNVSHSPVSAAVPGISADLAALATTVYRVTGNLWIVPLCLIFFDILITLDVEVKHFWNRGGNMFSTLLFFTIRYFPALNLVVHNIVLNLRYPAPSLCVFWFQYVGYSAGLEHMVVGAILILRLYAIFDCNKKLLVVLLALYGVTITTETVIIGVMTHHFQSQEALRNIFGGCAPLNIPTWCWVYWLPSVIFESILFLLALWKTILEARVKASRASPLMHVLLRDSVIYFGGIVIWSILNLGAWYINPLPLYGLFVGCHIGFQSILGARLLLNIRETAAVTSAYVASEDVPTIKFQPGHHKTLSVSTTSTTSTMV